MEHAKKSQLLLVSTLIFIFAVGFRLWGIKETGGTWDEDVYYNSAYHYYFNLKSLDFSRASWGWNFEHPPVAKYIYLPGAYLSQKLPDNPAFRPRVNYLPLRVESAIMGALTCVLVFLIGLHIFKSFWVGVYSGVILAFLPQFTAYGKLVSLESPQTFFLTGVLYFFLKLFTREVQSTNYKKIGIAPLGWLIDGGIGGIRGIGRDKKALLNLGGLAVSVALAFATKFSSGLVFLWMGLVLAFRFIVRASVLTSREPIFEKASRLKFILRVLLKDSKGKDLIAALLVPLTLLVFSFSFLIIIWPWLWHNPINDFIKSFTFSSQHFVAGEEKPFYYFSYLWYMTPLLITLTALIPVILCRRCKAYRFPILALVLWIVVFCAQALTGLKGGGVRYVLMVYPVLALLSGLGFSLFFERAYWRVEKLNTQKVLDSPPSANRSNFKKQAFLPVLILYLLANSFTVYPYLMDYYSESVGLVWGAKKRELPFGFRGEGIKRTTDWLNANAVQNANVAMIAMPDESPALRGDLNRQADPQSDTDYLVVLPPYAFEAGKDWELVHEEKVGGVATLAVVYRKATGNRL